MTAPGSANDVDASAAAWDAALRSPDCCDAQRMEFERWCADPRHRAAFDRLESALATLRDARNRPELQSLREAATRYQLRANTRRSWWTGASVAAGLAALSLALYTTPGTHQWLTAWYHGSGGNATPASVAANQTYVTAQNERATVALLDGSTVSLNSRTRVSVQFAGAERRVTLLAGQALFRVSKDPKRPFIVTAGARTVTALGTEFDVRVDPRKVQVTLLDGKVAVRSIGDEALRTAGQGITAQNASDPAGAVVLKPTDQYVAIDGAEPTVRTADVAKTTAWTEGRIFFDDEPLQSAVEELNRYSDTALIIDPAIAGYRINGMFRVGNQAGFADAVASMYDIDVRKDTDREIQLTRRLPIHRTP